MSASATLLRLSAVSDLGSAITILCTGGSTGEDKHKRCRRVQLEISSSSLHNQVQEIGLLHSQLRIVYLARISKAFLIGKSKAQRPGVPLVVLKAVDTGVLS